MSVKCWTQDHTELVLYFAIPSIIVWCITLPLICLAYLIRSRHKLETMNIKMMFGFLYHGYTPKHFYWEIIILYRKVILVCMSVFFTSSIEFQALSAFLLLLFCFFLQFSMHPFSMPQLNSLELKALLTASITIYSGLFCLTGDVDQGLELAIFSLMILANALFIANWIKAAFSQVFHHVIKKSRVFQVIYKGLRLPFIFRKKDKCNKVISELSLSGNKLFPGHPSFDNIDKAITLKDIEADDELHSSTIYGESFISSRAEMP
mmetsp:Transcript_12326/g.23395  ORF Transcript_12326/g.23395 Transcript_12326/m.23395 type:complete len:263 (+) Transcript_12326:1-789(+)